MLPLLWRFEMDRQRWEQLDSAAEEAQSMAALVANIQNWLLSQNVSRCIIAIKGRRFQLDVLFGISLAPTESVDLPELICPFAQEIEPFLPL
jgi:hypothetical protein